MESDRWQRVQALFEAAADLDPGRRDALLAQEPDAAIVEEVRALLEADERASSPIDGGALLPPSGLPADTPVGEYVIEARIGAGAFGVVYRAIHPVLKKRAAVKVLDRRFASDDTAVARFVTEAQSASQIGHPGIVDVFGFGALDDGAHYYLMEYVEGPSLADFVKERGPLSLEDALQILEPLAETLDAAHEHGVVHRDLKPANVMLVMRDGRPVPKLVDFGIAKLLGDQADGDHLTDTGTALGTPAYMAPEQARGRNVTAAADRYALGVMAFEMLTGQRPFTAGSTIETLMMHVNAPPPRPRELRPELPPHVDHAILALLEKAPEQRPKTACLGIAALREARSVAPPVPAAAPPPRRWPLVGGAVVAVAIVATAVFIRSADETVEATAIEAPPPTRAAEPPPPPPTPAAPEQSEVRIEGAPVGASIVDHVGRRLGRLPVTIVFDDPTKPRRLVVKKRGFAPKRLVVVPAETPRLEVSLEKKIHRDLESPF